MSDGDPLVRGSLEVRVGRGGARVGRVQVAEAERRPARADGPRARSDARRRGARRRLEPSEGPVWLNEWAAEDLDARVGDAVQLEYFVWTDEGGLETRQATLTLQGVLPMMRVGGDRTLTPDYPGITDAPDLGAWDPPFPVNLSLVRPKDEAYWDQWRAAPKAFVPLEIGQRLWGSRFGDVSSIRFALRDAEAVAAAVREEMSGQIVVRPVREEALAAAAGTTDFGEYFLYFSFFLVVSALLIAYLFFALGVEQRAREVGLLAAVGFPASRRSTTVPRRGAGGDARRGRGRRGRRCRVRRDHHVRLADVVGGRGRHDEPAAAPRSAGHVGRRRRRRGGGTGRHLDGDRRAGAPIAARADRGRRRRCGVGARGSWWRSFVPA